MSDSQAAESSSGTTKLTRSRNGCNECRRQHRRCGEEKPECQNCLDAGKACSYQRALSWGGRSFKKSTFKDYLGSGVVEIPMADEDDDSAQSSSFVYGKYPPDNASGTGSSSGNATVGTGGRSGSISVEQPGVDTYMTLIPWLSPHHRMLLHHFTQSTLKTFINDTGAQEEIRSAVIPMAADTNHGFSLLAAILSLASTHRKNLGLHQDQTEVEYWKDMSVGHLRRPTVQQDESTENVFAASALMLSIRDVISDTDKPFSWKLHLEGASTVFARRGDEFSVNGRITQRVLKKLARSLHLRSPLPISSSSPYSSSLDKAPKVDEGGVHGLPDGLASALQDIRDLKLEKSALQNIEIHSDSSNMGRLWTSLKAECLKIICRLRSVSHIQSGDFAEPNLVHQLYGYAGLLQCYWALLDLTTSDSGLRNTLKDAVSAVARIRTNYHDRLDPFLIFPLFTIGCVSRSPADRVLICSLISQVGREHGRENASLAKDFLEELWRRTDAKVKDPRPEDVDELMNTKGWDLPLW